MAAKTPFQNRARERRIALGLSQEDLARRCDLSRAAVGAIETGRVSPSVHAAMRLAKELGCSVEDLFESGTVEGSVWASEPGIEKRYWTAEVGGRRVCYPVEASPLGMIAHDEIIGGPAAPTTRTLVVAGCDPCGGILAGELARRHGIRLIQLGRSSSAALKLLRDGVVHAAGVHLAEGRGGNGRAVRDAIGSGFRLVRGMRWTQGIALARGSRCSTAKEALGVSWIGREEGSGADRCARRLFAREGRVPGGYARTARDHRGVASAIAGGFANAGICVRVAAEEERLGFLPLAMEDYDLCFRADSERDPLLAALFETLRSPEYRRIVGEVPGCSSTPTGEIADA